MVEIMKFGTISFLFSQVWVGSVEKVVGGGQGGLGDMLLKIFSWIIY